MKYRIEDSRGLDRTISVPDGHIITEIRADYSRWGEGPITVTVTPIIEKGIDPLIGKRFRARGGEGEEFVLVPDTEWVTDHGSIARVVGFRILYGNGRGYRIERGVIEDRIGSGIWVEVTA